MGIYGLIWIKKSGYIWVNMTRSLESSYLSTVLTIVFHVSVALS